MAALVRRGLSRRGPVDVARTGEDALWMAGLGRLRRGRARRDAAGDRRVRDLPPAARGRRLDAGAAAHRARLGRGPRRRARRRRRRLPDEAVLVRRAVRAAARARQARQKERPAVLEVGGLRLDPGDPRAWRGGEAIELSTKEFALLEAFMRRPGEVLSRLELLEHAWDFGYENRSNVIDVYVRYLREKIDRPFGVKSIETVRGAGYRLRRTGARAEPSPDPHPPDARLHGRDGGRAACGRAVRVLARGIRPRLRARPRPAHARGRPRRRGTPPAASLGEAAAPRRER